MAEPRWMSFVSWPRCENCNTSGVAICPQTQWPIECPKCKTGREHAVKQAQEAVRAERRHGSPL